MEQENMRYDTSARKQDAQKKKRKMLILLILLLLLLVLTASAAAYFYLFSKNAEPVSNDGPQFAANASVGALPGKTREEIEAMLNQQIDDKMVAFTVNAEPYFDNGTAKGNLMLESPANNINYIEFVIRRDDTGETIYRSGLLMPNQYIEEDVLSVDLDKGEYPCTVDVTIYDTETMEAKGMSQAAIVITVLN